MILLNLIKIQNILIQNRNPDNPRWDCVKVKYKSKSDKILSLPELKSLFNEDELLVVKKGNRLSILPVKNDIAKLLLEKI